MIAVKPRPEPASFNAQVRVPGNAWLVRHPPSHKKKLPDYWRRCLPDLRTSYKGICAYFCCYVRPATGGGSADHFVPKSKARNVAYDWDNYRFACTRMNSRKRDASDVLDPFFLMDGWFTIYFPTMRVKPSGGLSATDLQKVKATIKRLKLNSRECIEERAEYWDDYRTNNISAFQLQKHAPFIAMEAARQGLLKPADAAITVASIRAWLDS